MNWYVPNETELSVRRSLLVASWVAFAILQGLLVLFAVGIIELLRRLGLTVEPILHQLRQVVGPSGSLLVLSSDCPFAVLGCALLFQVPQLWLHIRVVSRDPRLAWTWIAFAALFEVLTCLFAVTVSVAFLLIALMR